MDNPYAAELRILPRGECYTRCGSRTTRERVIPLPAPFGLSPETLAGVVTGLRAAVKQGPDYYLPGEPKCSSGTDPAESAGFGGDTGDSPFGI